MTKTRKLKDFVLPEYIQKSKIYIICYENKYQNSTVMSYCISTETEINVD